MSWAEKMGNMQGIMAVGAVMVIGSVTGTTVPSWLLVVVFVAARFLPTILGFAGGGPKAGALAAPLDDSVVMLQGPLPDTRAEGVVTVVERWATWCPPCVATIPHLNKLFDEYGSRPDVQMVAVTNESDMGKIRAFMGQHGMKYPVGLDTKGVVAAG